jgi:hypothetical protein
LGGFAVPIARMDAIFFLPTLAFFAVQALCSMSPVFIRKIKHKQYIKT